MGESVTDTGANFHVQLDLGLQMLQSAVDDLARASILNKSVAADKVLKNAKELIENIVEVVVPNVYEVRLLKARLVLVEEELKRIGNIGVIKNG